MILDAKTSTAYDFELSWTTNLLMTRMDNDEAFH